MQIAAITVMQASLPHLPPKCTDHYSISPTHGTAPTTAHENHVPMKTKDIHLCIMMAAHAFSELINSTPSSCDLIMNYVNGMPCIIYGFYLLNGGMGM